MAEAVLGPLVENLNSLIQREVLLAWRVKADLSKLSSSLIAIQAVLADAEVQQIKSKAVRDWLMKLRDAAYDAQDILDDWAVADEARHRFNAATRMNRVRQSFLSLLNLKRLLFRYKIVKQLKEIRERFDDIAKEKSDFHLKEGVVLDVDGVVNTHHTIDPTRETSPFLNEPHIYGRDDDRDKVVKMLLENSNIGHGIAVCPIVGIGGLGKTTLAQLVYNDDRVQKHFDKRIWICVSDDFNGKRLLKEIVHLVTGNRLDHDNLGEVQKSVMEAVRGKKFLLVLDDVWSENQDDFNMLKNPLSSGAKGSSIVVTTRLEKVASITKAILEPYKLGDLSDNHCWSLFRSYAFDGNEKPHLERIGRDIVKKCGGLPLAAKALGSLLQFIDEEKQWEQVRDSEIWDLEEEEEKKGRQSSRILPALRLSYNFLSPRARQCFAYCSFFPKDYEMSKEEIVHLWLANGLLQSEKMEAKSVGEKVFNQLKLHSFFQDMEVDEENKITFKIHDLLHDLASSVMKKEHSRIVIEVGRNTTYDIQNAEIRLRHMSITMSHSLQSSSVELSHLPPSLLSHHYHLRTLFLFSNHYESLRLSSQDVSIIYGLKYLRALRIDRWSCVLEELPASFGNKLKHLKMLSLRWCGLSSLQAKSFYGMRNLQFLDLSYNRSLTALPNAMGKHLEDLRLLNLRECGLSSLQIGSFRGMKKLETLDLSGNPMMETLPNSIGKCLESLRRLSLTRCGLLLLPDEVFSGMKNLRFLDLSDNNQMKSLSDSIGNLEKLRHLDLSKNSCLTTLPESIGNLTELETLKLNACYELTMLPQNTSKLCSLKHLENDLCGRLTGMRLGQHLTRLEKLSRWVGESENIAELRALDLLSGSLEIILKEEDEDDLVEEEEEEIRALNLVSDSQSKEGEARHILWEEEKDVLTNKTNLSRVHINFPIRDEGVDRMEEQVLRVLKPPSNIEDLEILDYKGMRFPDWMQMRDPHSSFPRLRSIELCSTLYVEEWWLNWREKECLPALQDLQILFLHSLKALPEELGNLTSLKSLEIAECSALVSVPTTLHQLTSLESLRISSCRELTSLPLLQLMTSLKELEIWDCPKLKFMFHGLQHLTSLKELEIWDCPGVVIPKKELETLVALRGSNLSKNMVDEELIVDHDSTTSEFSGKQVLHAPPDDDDDGPQ